MSIQCKYLGERIRAARLSAGLSQRQLAGDEFTRGYISQIETSLINPSLSSLQIIAGRLGKSLSWFTEDMPPLDVPPPLPRSERRRKPELTSTEKELLELYRQCNLEKRHAMMVVARLITGDKVRIDAS